MDERAALKRGDGASETIAGAGNRARTLAQRRRSPAGEARDHVIITCEKCATQFQLDEARIPERGARVRCSRCKHAFHVKKEAAVPDRVERAVESALTERELPASVSAGALQEGFEESDWEFNHDSGAGAGAAGGTLDAEGTRWPDVGAGPDLGAAGALEEAAGGAERSGDLFGDSSAEGTGDAPSGLDLSSDPLAGLLEDDEPAAAGSAETERVEPAPPPRARRAAPREAAQPAAPRAPALRIPLGRLGQLSGRSLASPAAESEAQLSAGALWILRGLHALGWVAAALLAALAFHGALAGGARPALSAATPRQMAGLEVAALEGRWIENAARGPLFVVSLELRNAEAHPVAPAARFAVRLYDAAGRLIEEDAASAGPLYPAEILRLEDPRSLRAAHGLAARVVAAETLAPGGSRVLQAVLADLPHEAARFDVAALPLAPSS
jgi:predicted Zn finger-like uncharacterized protein